MEKHRCEKMPAEIYRDRDHSYLRYYYDDKEQRIIHFCHYCGAEFKVVIEEMEGK